MSKINRYYEKAKNLSNKNYVSGRNFEYRVIKFLTKRGYDCMRRFGSHDKNVKGIGKVPVDVTAFRGGTYLIISCKYSMRRPTTYLDDPKRENLVKYCERFGKTCIPIFAGVNSKRQIYFVDLRNYKEATRDLYFKYKNPSKEPAKKDVELLIEEAWSLIDFCNQVITSEDKEITLKMKVRFANTKASMVGHLTRLLYKAGATSAVDDITAIIAREEELLEKEGEEEDAKGE